MCRIPPFRGRSAQPRLTGILMELCPGGDLVNYMTEGLGAFDEVRRGPSFRRLARCSDMF